MNIKTSARLQVGGSLRSIITFYGVILAICLLFTIIVMVLPGNASGTLGMDTASLIFAFVLGLCSFKESFMLHLQLGCSRRSMFLGHLAAVAVIAAGMAVADTLISLLLTAIVALSGRQIIISNADTAFGLTGAGEHFAQLLIQLACLLFFLLLGFCVSALYYRLNTAGKVIVSVGVPALFVVVLPLVETHLTHGLITHAVGQLLAFAFGSAWMTVLSLLVLAALAGLFSWLLMRRADVKA